MRILKLIFVLFISLSAAAQPEGENATFVPSTDAEGLFREGNEAYKANDFEKSIELYSQIIAAGKESAEVYFNLGNAFFKKGENTQAILNYERALKLSPEDEDIRTNLQIANLRTIDKVEAQPEMFLSLWWKELLNINTVDRWGSWSIYAIFAALAVFIIYLLTKGIIQKASFFIGLFLFVISLGFMILGSRLKSVQISNEYAIITSPTVTVKSSPENESTKLFVIHEGTKVQCLDEVEGWTEISLMNGNKGWVKSEVFQAI